MVSDFGKELRKIRIDNNEILKGMADKLEITSAYLSAIENGKREIPKNFVQKISSIYNLDSGKTEALRAAYEKTLKSVVLELDSTDGNRRDLALKFARTFKSMDDGKVSDFLRFMNREDNL